MNDFDYLRIYHRGAGSAGSYYANLLTSYQNVDISVADFKKTAASNNYQNYALSCTYGAGGYMVRQFYYTSDTSIGFRDCGMINYNSTANYFDIPIAIYGVKYVSSGGSSGMQPGTYWSGSPSVSGTIQSGVGISWTLSTGAYGATFIARPHGEFSQVTHASNTNGWTDTVIKMDGTMVNLSSSTTIDLTDVDYYISAHVRNNVAINLNFTFT